MLSTRNSVKPSATGRFEVSGTQPKDGSKRLKLNSKLAAALATELRSCGLSKKEIADVASNAEKNVQKSRLGTWG